MILTMLPVAAMEIKYNFYKNYNDYKDYSGVETATAGTGWPRQRHGGARHSHINKINAHSVVVPNVDANDPKIYMEALKMGWPTL